MSAQAEIVRLGEGGWFGLLLDEALANAQPLALAGRALDEAVRDELWDAGVLAGHGESGPVAVRTPIDGPFLTALRYQLALGARLVVAARLGAARDRQQLELAALVAAHAGELATAVVLEDAANGGTELDERARRRLLGVVGARLLRAAYLLGNPQDGLPLHFGLVALEVRAFARLAAGHLARGGVLRRRSLLLASRLSGMKALYVELVASLWGHPEPRAAVARQVRGAGLGSTERRRLLRTLEVPRLPAEIARALPRPLRSIILEQLVVAALADGRTDLLEGPLAHLAHALGQPPSLLSSARARGAAMLVTHEAGLRVLRAGQDGLALRDVAEGAADALARTLENAQRELAETGELGTLLARQARGEKLTAEERAKVREQLLDLAKVVPSVAIFAAPGGALLLPLVLKVLPFDLRPSSFRPAPRPRPALPGKVEPPEAA